MFLNYALLVSCLTEYGYIASIYTVKYGFKKYIFFLLSFDIFSTLDNFSFALFFGNFWWQLVYTC